MSYLPIGHFGKPAFIHSADGSDIGKIVVMSLKMWKAQQEGISDNRRIDSDGNERQWSTNDLHVG